MNGFSWTRVVAVMIKEVRQLTRDRVTYAMMLGIPVLRPQVVETTALGAAYLAGLASGLWRGVDEVAAQWQLQRRFEPTLPRERAAELMAGWEHAVRQATAA